jgi:hypothetical protein
MLELCGLVLRKAEPEELNAMHYKVRKTTYEWSTRHEGILLCLGKLDEGTGMLKHAVICNEDIGNDKCFYLGYEWFYTLTSLFKDISALRERPYFCERNVIDERTLTDKTLIFAYNGIFLKCVAER